MRIKNLRGVSEVRFILIRNFLRNGRLKVKGLILYKFKLFQESPQNIQITESDGELGTQDSDGRVTNAENLGDLSQSIRDQSSKCKVSISKINFSIFNTYSLG